MGAALAGAIIVGCPLAHAADEATANAQQSTATPAAANQAASRQAAATIADVVVTATLTEESLQKVPVAVTVVDGKQAEKENLNNINDISTIVPSLNFRDGASNKDQGLFIRKGPAYNVFFNMVPATQGKVLDPETSESFEIGVKTKLFDDRLVLNAAAFHTDFENFQANFPNLIGGTVVTNLVNAGTVTSQGVELDFTAKPTQSITLSGGVAYTDARITSTDIVGRNWPIEGQTVPFTPKWKANVRADYLLPLNDKYDIDFGTRVRWQSDVQYDLANVVMLTRPMQRQFEQGEKSLEDLHKIDRDLLKQEQRAEREAFFKDGSKIFKAERHRIYDEVRKEYAPEWRQFYKDKAAAEKEAQQFSKAAMAQALSFAGEGRWGDAREAYENSHAILDAVSRDFAARKADLKARQMEDVRERQTLGCNSLREARDADYKELLQRQRDERASLTATHASGGERAVDLVAQTLSLYAANENASAEAKLPEPANTNPAPMQENTARTGTQDGISISSVKAPELDLAAFIGSVGQAARPEGYRGPDDDRLAGRRDGVDLATTAIGSAASYIADQLGEFLTPTPPELRAARAREEARREAEKPAPDPAKDDIWTRHIEAALRIAEQERESKRSRDYWTERERTKEGRDR